jgi:hypothetical protein
MKELSPDLSSIVIVPKQVSKSFGSLFEVRCSNDEIFVSGATVDDIEIISSITADRLRAEPEITTSTTTRNTLGGNSL